MPVTSPYSSNYGSTIDGFKVRELFARPNAHDRKFFYAANFEFGVNHSYWESTDYLRNQADRGAALAPMGFHLQPGSRYGLYRGTWKPAVQAGPIRCLGAHYKESANSILYRRTGSDAWKPVRKVSPIRKPCGSP
jgi:hypothetical protein